MIIYKKENQLAAQAVGSGNLGGGREGVGIAELQRQKADILGGIYGTGFQSALGELQTQRAFANTNWFKSRSTLRSISRTTAQQKRITTIRSNGHLVA